METQLVMSHFDFALLWFRNSFHNILLELLISGALDTSQICDSELVFTAEASQTLCNRADRSASSLVCYYRFLRRHQSLSAAQKQTLFSHGRTFLFISVQRIRQLYLLHPNFVIMWYCNILEGGWLCVQNSHFWFMVRKQWGEKRWINIQGSVRAW